MSYRIGDTINQFIKHSYEFLTVKNVVMTGCIGIIGSIAISKFVEALTDFADSKRGIPNIRAIFRKPYHEGLLETMNETLKNAETDISFLGWRYITSKKYQVRISMEEVADRIEWLSQYQMNISDKERTIGQSFSETILDLYDRGDKKLEQKNYFTSLLCHLRDTHLDLLGANSYGWHKWHGLSLFQKKA